MKKATKWQTIFKLRKEKEAKLKTDIAKDVQLIQIYLNHAVLIKRIRKQVEVRI